MIFTSHLISKGDSKTDEDKWRLGGFCVVNFVLSSQILFSQSLFVGVMLSFFFLFFFWHFKAKKGFNQHVIQFIIVSSYFL